MAAGILALSVVALPGIAMAKDKDHDGNGDRARDARDVRIDTRDIRHDRVDALKDERRKDRIQADLHYDLQHPLANREDIRKDIRRLDRVQYDLNRPTRPVSGPSGSPARCERSIYRPRLVTSPRISRGPERGPGPRRFLTARARRDRPA